MRVPGRGQSDGDTRLPCRAEWAAEFLWYLVELGAWCLAVDRVLRIGFRGFLPPLLVAYLIVAAPEPRKHAQVNPQEDLQTQRARSGILLGSQCLSYCLLLFACQESSISRRTGRGISRQRVYLGIIHKKGNFTNMGQTTDGLWYVQRMKKSQGFPGERGGWAVVQEGSQLTPMAPWQLARCDLECQWRVLEFCPGPVALSWACEMALGQARVTRVSCPVASWHYFS